jgi:hypothetical protein
MLAFILLTSSVTFTPSMTSCLSIDPCCNLCLKRYETCDLINNSLLGETECLKHKEQCLNRCQKQPQPEQKAQPPQKNRSE